MIPLLIIISIINTLLLLYSPPCDILLLVSLPCRYHFAYPCHNSLLVFLIVFSLSLFLCFSFFYRFSASPPCDYPDFASVFIIFKHYQRYQKLCQRVNFKKTDKLLYIQPLINDKCPGFFSDFAGNVHARKPKKSHTKLANIMGIHYFSGFWNCLRAHEEEWCQLSLIMFIIYSFYSLLICANFYFCLHLLHSTPPPT